MKVGGRGHHNDRLSGEVEVGRLHSDIEVDVNEGKAITLPSNWASVRTGSSRCGVRAPTAAKPTGPAHQASAARWPV